MRHPRLWGLGVATAVALAIVEVPAQVVFHSTTNYVTVTVSVRQSGRPIPNLTLQDFEVTDAGHPQILSEATYERFPSDVTFVVDLSGSITSGLLDTLRSAVATVSRRLGPEDRTSVQTFNHRIQVRQPMIVGAPSLDFGRPDGGTSLVDAVTIALLAKPAPERRRAVIVFSDGRDTTSFTEGSALVDIAARRDAAIFVVALRTNVQAVDRDRNSLFNRMARVSGGQALLISNRDEVSGSFLRAFEDFRSSYVLRYTYAGPEVPGWHELGVKVLARGQFDIRARQGYQTQ
jgi:hypothetical protein